MRRNAVSCLTLNLLRAKMLVLLWKGIQGYVILSEAKNLYYFLRDPSLVLRAT